MNHFRSDKIVQEYIDIFNFYRFKKKELILRFPHYYTHCWSYNCSDCIKHIYDENLKKLHRELFINIFPTKQETITEAKITLDKIFCDDISQIIMSYYTPVNFKGRKHYIAPLPYEEDARRYRDYKKHYL